MPEIIVRAEGGDETPVLLRERVTQGNLQSEHYAGQLIERIGWAVADASPARAVAGAATLPKKS